MKELAAEIRAQLRAAPNRKTFRKRREKLLEIAVALEAAHHAIYSAQTYADAMLAARGDA